VERSATREPRRIAFRPGFRRRRGCIGATETASGLQRLRLFRLAERHTLLREGHAVQVFHPELTSLRRQVLTLVGVPQGAFRPPA